MEPVTHILTGACLARTGFNRRAAYAMLTMAVAAEFPDVDTLWSLRGPIEGFQHHRGITHTFLGLPFEAALIVAAVYGWHQWRVRRSGFRSEEHVSPSNKAVVKIGHPASERPMKPLTAAPVRWGVLYGLALLALLSHLLLDYTNNYGLRPFFPFNDRWYAASIVFIFDPVMFVLLLGALVAPWLFGLVSSEVGARKQPFRARGWAIVALLGVVGWWTLREMEHQHAVQLAMAQSIAAPVEDTAPMAKSEVPDPGGQDSLPGSRGTGHLDTGSDASVAAETVPTYLSAQRILASPDPLSPFRWSVVTDFGPLYQLAEIDMWNRSLTTDETTYPKPGRSVIVLAAEESKLGRVYMDWSPMPIVNVTKPDSELAAATDGKPDAANKVVTFRDPRFMGGWMREAGRSALAGTVTVDAAEHVMRETMDGQVEHDDR